MRILSILGLLAGLMLSGCATDHFTMGKGDAGDFILHKAEHYGAKPAKTNVVSSLTGAWRYLGDEYGVVVQMPGADFPALEAFLREAFGPPQLGPKPSKKVPGTTYGAYRLTPKGGGLQFSVDGKNLTQVVIIRPLSERKSEEAAERILEDDEMRKTLNETQ